jgi:hypothetical protein
MSSFTLVCVAAHPAARPGESRFAARLDQGPETSNLRRDVVASTSGHDGAYWGALSQLRTTAAYVWGSSGFGVRGRMPSIAVQTLCIIS